MADGSGNTAHCSVTVSGASVFAILDWDPNGTNSPVPCSWSGNSFVYCNDEYMTNFVLYLAFTRQAVLYYRCSSSGPTWYTVSFTGRSGNVYNYNINLNPCGCNETISVQVSL